MSSSEGPLASYVRLHTCPNACPPSIPFPFLNLASHKRFMPGPRCAIACQVQEKNKRTLVNQPVFMRFCQQNRKMNYCTSRSFSSPPPTPPMSGMVSMTLSMISSELRASSDPSQSDTSSSTSSTVNFLRLGSTLV